MTDNVLYFVSVPLPTPCRLSCQRSFCSRGVLSWTRQNARGEKSRGKTTRPEKTIMVGVVESLFTQREIPFGSSVGSIARLGIYFLQVQIVRLFVSFWSTVKVSEDRHCPKAQREAETERQRECHSGSYYSRKISGVQCVRDRQEHFIYDFFVLFVSRYECCCFLRMCTTR